MAVDDRVLTLLDHLPREAVAAILSVTEEDIHANVAEGTPLPSGGGGGGGVLNVGDPFDVSGHPFDSFWTPGDGTHPTFLAVEFRVSAAAGQSATAWVEIWPADNFDNDGILGSLSLDRTAESGDTGAAVVDGWVYGLVPPGMRARCRHDDTGGTSTVVGQHEHLLTVT